MFSKNTFFIRYMVKKFKSTAKSLCEIQISKLYFMMVIETLEAVL